MAYGPQGETVTSQEIGDVRDYAARKAAERQILNICTEWNLGVLVSAEFLESVLSELLVYRNGAANLNQRTSHAE